LRIIGLFDGLAGARFCGVAARGGGFNLRMVRSGFPRTSTGQVPDGLPAMGASAASWQLPHGAKPLHFTVHGEISLENASVQLSSNFPMWTFRDA
jgi:hypothetical protein